MTISNYHERVLTDSEKDLLQRCLFLPILKMIEEVTDADTKQVERIYYISVQLQDGHELPTYQFRNLHIQSYYKYWPECIDARLNKGIFQKLEEVLQHQSQSADVTIKRKIYYPRLGLYDDAYVFGNNEVISFSPENGEKEFITEKSLPSFGHGEISEETAPYLLELITLMPGYSEILFLTHLVSILKPLFCQEGFPVDFSLGIFGTSGYGKTTLARLFFVFQEDQESSFQSCRLNYIESFLKSYPGHAFLFDDFHPEAQSQAKNRQEHFLNKVVRAKGGKDFALPVITGEYQSGCFSVQDRIVQLQLAIPFKDFEKFHSLNRNRTILSNFSFAFARKIYMNQNLLSEKIDQYMRNAESKSTGFRISHNLTYYKICADLFYNIILEKNDQEQYDRVAQSLSGCQRGFLSYIFQLLDHLENAQIRHMRKVKLLEGSPDWGAILYNMILGEDKVFTVIESEDQRESLSLDALYIRSEKSFYYIRPQILQIGLCRYFCTTSPIKQEMVSWLADYGILDEDASHSHAKKREKIYYYVIRKDMLYLHCMPKAK